MNRNERKKQSLDLARAMQKGLKPNELNRQLLQYVSTAPLYSDSNDFVNINQGYEINPDVYSIVNGITKAGASVPFIVSRVKNVKHLGEYYRKFKSLANNASQKNIGNYLDLKEEVFEEVDGNDDLYKLLENPNPIQSFSEWYENTKGFQLLTGNAYNYGVPLTDGRLGEMWIMPSQWTRIIADAGSQELIKGYTMELYGGVLNSIEAKQVMHWKYWNPDYGSPGSHLYGMSPLKAAAKSLTLSNNSDTSLIASINNGGANGMLFPDDDAFDTISPQLRSQIRSHLRKNSNPESNGSFLVFPTKMGYTQFGQSPHDLQIIEAGKMSLRDLCNIYGYPSEMLNDPDNKTNSNKKESRRQLYLDLVIPTLVRDYNELNKFVLPFFNNSTSNFKNYKYHISFDINAIEAIQVDNKDKVDWLSKAYWLTDNEKRAEMGYQEIEGGDVIYRPANLIPEAPLDLLPLDE